MAKEFNIEEILKKTKLETITPDVVEWTEIGQELTGILVAVDAAPSKDDGKEYLRYTVKTASGLYNCGLGVIADQIMQRDRFVGHVVRFEFNGKRKTGRGNESNVFTIQVSDAPVI